MRQLQSQLQGLSTERDDAASKLQQSLRKGVIDGQAAGAKQVSLNVNSSRYELNAGELRTGLSCDPLVQTPGRGANPFSGRDVEARATSVDNIGNHVTASPFVRPGDFTVPGDRPETAGSQPSVRSVRLFCRNFALILP